MKLQFVVVGRPNKGKSSIVATLARDENVAISSQSGTTRVSESFEVQVGVDSFVLVDTPGIQRPGKVLAWLDSYVDSIGGGADKRGQAIAAFLADPANREQFPDEVDLLGAIMQESSSGTGSAFIYVVDGSVPYDQSYEAEMAIMQWTGKLSLAVINPIESDEHVPQWQAALNQYFKLVRVFNPHRDDADCQVQLLEDFAHIDPAWKAPLTRIVSAIRQEVARQVHASAELAADMLDEICRYKISRKVPGRRLAEELKPTLEAAFFNTVREKERRALVALHRLYRHEKTDRRDTELSIPEDLFDTRQWALWGLSRRGLTLAGATAGAVAGAGADVMAAGLTFGVMTAGGAALGGMTAWLGLDKLVDLKVRGLPAGGYEAIQGPVTSPNFPYVLLGRFLAVQRALANRNHARRDCLVMDKKQASLLEQAMGELTDMQRKGLHRVLTNLSRQKPAENLSGLLLPVFESGRTVRDLPEHT